MIKDVTFYLQDVLDSIMKMFDVSSQDAYYMLENSCMPYLISREPDFVESFSPHFWAQQCYEIEIAFHGDYIVH